MSEKKLTNKNIVHQVGVKYQVKIKVFTMYLVWIMCTKICEESLELTLKLEN